MGRGQCELKKKKKQKTIKRRENWPEAHMFRALRPALVGLYVLLCVHCSASSHWSLAEATLPRAVPQRAALRLRGAGDAADASAGASPAAGAALRVAWRAARAAGRLPARRTDLIAVAGTPQGGAAEGRTQRAAYVC